MGWAAGIGLLVVLVPARHLLFNENGTALAMLVAGLAVFAVGLVVWRLRRHHVTPLG